MHFTIKTNPLKYSDLSDIFWLKDNSIEDSANLPAQEVLAQEIADNLEGVLE